MRPAAARLLRSVRVGLIEWKVNRVQIWPWVDQDSYQMRPFEGARNLESEFKSTSKENTRELRTESIFEDFNDLSLLSFIIKKCE